MSEVNEPVVIGSVEEFERAYGLGPGQVLLPTWGVALGVLDEPRPWWSRFARRLLRRAEPAPVVVTRILGPDDG